jgi:guanylate kinase
MVELVYYFILFGPMASAYYFSPVLMGGRMALTLYSAKEEGIKGRAVAEQGAAQVPAYARRLEILAEIEEASKPLLDKEFVERTVAAWNRPMPEEYTSQPLVLVGPSGVGKGRLVKSLLRDWEKYFGKVVTHTTRAPRPDEIDGTSYHFVDTDSYHDLVKTGDYFMEHAQVHNNFYGVSREAWQKVVKQRKIPIFEIDVQGAMTVKAMASSLSIDPKYIFVSPKKLDMLRERLSLRGTEKQEEVELRIANAQKELDFITQNPSFFDHVLINDDFSLTSNSFFRLSRDEYKWLPSAAKMQMLLRRIDKVKRLKKELATLDEQETKDE